MSSQGNRQNDQSNPNGNYRKVFKPNLGGGNKMPDKSRKPHEMDDNSFPGNSKPASRPPINTRLNQKLPQRHGGMSNDMDEDQVEYQPSKRNGALRSSRVTESSSYNNAGAKKGISEVGSNIPRASNAPKKTIGSMPKSTASGMDQPIPASTIKSRAKPAAAYSDDFGDDAYEQPQDLTPCPSCGRRFNKESLVKHKKVCQKVFQTKAKKFNMQAQRVIDNDHKQLLRDKQKEDRKFGGLKDKNKRSAALPGSNKGKWLKQSEAFRNAMRAARGAKPLNGGGGGDYGAGSTQEDDGYVPCPH